MIHWDFKMSPTIDLLIKMLNSELHYDRVATIWNTYIEQQGESGIAIYNNCESNIKKFFISIDDFFAFMHNGSYNSKDPYFIINVDNQQIFSLPILNHFHSPLDWYLLAEWLDSDPAGEFRGFIWVLKAIDN